MTHKIRLNYEAINAFDVRSTWCRRDLLQTVHDFSQQEINHLGLIVVGLNETIEEYLPSINANL